MPSPEIMTARQFGADVVTGVSGTGDEDQTASDERGSKMERGSFFMSASLASLSTV